MGSGWVSEGAGSGKAFNRQLRSGGRSEPHWNGESQNHFSSTHPTNLLLQTHSLGFPKAWQPLERRGKRERESGIVSESERAIWLGLRDTKWQTRQAGDRIVQIYSKVCWYKLHNYIIWPKIWGHLLCEHFIPQMMENNIMLVRTAIIHFSGKGFQSMLTFFSGCLLPESTWTLLGSALMLSEYWILINNTSKKQQLYVCGQ